jgi:phenylalanyl-tRNA synthetase alpha chain
MMDTTALKKELIDLVVAANDMNALENVRVTALGKKGKITDLMKNLGTMSAEDRKAAGAELNVLKDEISALIEKQAGQLKKQELDARLANEQIDVTLSVRPQRTGSIHPISQTMDELVSIFADMGFAVAEGPDIEDDFHNFTALNFPLGHPAREMHDTFYLPNDERETGEAQKKVLRTHTSTVQIRHMLNNKPPIKMICFGRCYRSDWDMTHTPVFHQMEALYIDKNVNMGHLKGCLSDFVRSFFGIDDLPVRFRPSFFPFTEPSAEVDIFFNGRWIEWGGCGMVNPKVLTTCGIDTDVYSGFAFGMGLERTLMVRHNITDMHDIVEGDIRFTRAFGLGI